MKEKSPFAAFARYASLNMLGMLGVSLYVLTDTFFIARGLGEDGLVALNLALPVCNFVFGAGLMLGVGGSTKYVIARSRGQEREAEAVFRGTLLTAAAISAVMMLTGALCSRQITALLRADARVFEMTDTYLKTILLFTPAFVLQQIFVSFTRSDGAPGLSMAAVLAGSLCNILFDYLFIFPLHMGIFGAVLATVFSPLIGLAILSFRRKKAGFRLKKGPVPAKLLGSILALGAPSMISEVAAGVVMIVLNLLLLRLRGNVAVAAYGVIANIAIVVTSLYNGVAQGTQPLMSGAYGRGEKGGAERFLAYALGASAVLTALIDAVMLLFAGPVAAVFNKAADPVMQELAVRGLHLYFSGILFAGANTVLGAYFTATERPLPAQTVSLMRGFAVVLPMAFVLSALLGLDGVWLTVPVSEAITAAAALTMLFVGKKRRSAA